MESHIGDTTEFDSFDGVSRCKQGHLRPNGFGIRDLYENFCESFEGAGGAVQVSPCSGGGAQEHTHSLFEKLHSGITGNGISTGLTWWLW